MVLFNLELFKLFLGSGSFGHLQNVESNGLTQGPAFSDCDNIADGNVSVGWIDAGIYN